MSDKWHRRFLEMSALVSAWSKDPSTKVGAVIVDQKRRVVGVGYNGFGRNVRDDGGRLECRDIKYEMTVHAEANALLNSARTEGCTIYLTHPPCARCSALLIQAGIIGVVWRKPDGEFAARWGMSQALSEQQLAEAEIWIREVE